jgi:hypothetical protein
MIPYDELAGFPWQIVSKFCSNRKDLKLVISFKSGNGIECESPDLETFEQMTAEARKHLKNHQIEVIE